MEIYLNSETVSEKVGGWGTELVMLPQKWTKSPAERLAIVVIIKFINPIQKKVEEKTGYKSRTAIVILVLLCEVWEFYGSAILIFAGVST